MDGLKYEITAEAVLAPQSTVAHGVGWGFISLYTLAFMSTNLVFLAPILVTLPLRVNSLVGIQQAPKSLGLVAGIGALVSMFGNPFFGRMSDRTWSRLGMRRPWMVIGLVGGTLGILVVALAPNIPVVLVGWCLAQLFFNALLAAFIAVLPDQVPRAQRGLVSGVLGVCLPIAAVSGTLLVKLFTGHPVATFLVPCAIGGFFILLFVVALKDRRLARAARPAWSLREFASTFYVRPRTSPDFAWAFASRFMFLLAYARRKIFVFIASIVYGLAMFAVAIASNFNGFVVGMAISGLGFGIYTAVDLALVADVLPSKDNVAKDLGVFNIAGALPFSLAPAGAPVILAIGGGNYGVLYAAAGIFAIVGAVAILPVRGVR